MAKAKTASKNNPSSRGKVSVILFNGKEVKPVNYVSLKTLTTKRQNFMAVQYTSDGSLALDKQGNPIPWQRIPKTS